MNTELINKINDRLLLLDIEKEHLKKEIRDLESKKDEISLTLYCETFGTISTKLVETKSKITELNVVMNIIKNNN